MAILYDHAFYTIKGSGSLAMTNSSQNAKQIRETVPGMDLAGAASQADLLEAALARVLACPGCRGRLALDPHRESLRCAGCGAAVPLVEGIPVFTEEGSGLQVEEKAFRNRAASKEMRQSAGDLLKGIAKHYSVPLMAGYALDFRRRFSREDWLLDMGTGYSWHWKDAPPGPRVIGIDMSLGNLLLANRLLGDRGRCVLLICGDASRLPLADRTMAGVWSVQAFQLFPEPVFQQAQQELDRVLKSNFLMEFHHAHPSPFYRLLARLRGKSLYRRGRSKSFETNWLLLSEWESRWRLFRDGCFTVSRGYSELFFHPELHIRPRPYPSRLERLLSRWAPMLVSLFARQRYLRLESRSSGNLSHAVETVST